jgi:hypothetical protein
LAGGGKLELGRPGGGRANDGGGEDKALGTSSGGGERVSRGGWELCSNRWSMQALKH